MVIAIVAAVAVAAVPAAATQKVSVQDIVEVASLSGLAISPNGRWLAFRSDRATVATNDYDLGWYIVAADGRSAPVRVADGGSAIINTGSGEVLPEQPLWSPDSRTLFFRARFAGAIQVWRTDLTGHATAITHDAANVRSFSITADGAAITYRAGAARVAVESAQRDRYRDGTLVDARVDMASPVAGGEIIDGKRTLLEFEGYYFNREALLADAPLREVTVTLATGAATTRPAPATPPTPKTWIPVEDVARNGDRVITQRGPKGPAVTIIRASGVHVSCKITQCLARQLQSAAWQVGGDALVLSLRDANRADSLYFWPVGAAAARPIARSAGTLDGGRTGEPNCTASREAVFCVEASAIKPPMIVRVALRGNDVRTLADPNAALRAGLNMPVRRMAWRADGHGFTGVLLTSTAHAAPVPLVIDYYYCDGFLRGGVGTEVPVLPLVESDIAVLCINHPPNRDGDTALLTYEAGLAGVREAVRMLSADKTIDPARVGMAGFSFGSEVTNWVALHSNLLAAASISSAQYEPAMIWANALPGRNVTAIYQSYFGLGWPDRDAGGWQKMAPAMTIETLTIPMLMQMPEREARYAMEYYTRALRAEKAVELHVFADEPHILAQPAHQAAAYTRELDWFRFWLQHVEDPDAAKADQYRRWRALATRQPKPVDRLDP